VDAQAIGSAYHLNDRSLLYSSWGSSTWESRNEVNWYQSAEHAEHCTTKELEDKHLAGTSPVLTDVISSLKRGLDGRFVW
jgi:hypothetical protein